MALVGRAPLWRRAVNPDLVAWVESLALMSKTQQEREITEVVDGMPDEGCHEALLRIWTPVAREAGLLKLIPGGFRKAREVFGATTPALCKKLIVKLILAMLESRRREK